MNTWIHTLLQDLEYQLPFLSNDKALIHCREINARLAGYMEQYQFKSRAEEVLYFKTFKPRFMAHQLKYEILVSGEILDTRSVDENFRNYYRSNETKSDGFYFTFRSCRKTDFDLPIRQTIPSGWETGDKMIARILVEEWLSKEVSHA